jgi:hypothetical protein
MVHDYVEDNRPGTIVVAEAAYQLGLETKAVRTTLRNGGTRQYPIRAIEKAQGVGVWYARDTNTNAELEEKISEALAPHEPVNLESTASLTHPEHLLVLNNGLVLLRDKQDGSVWLAEQVFE